MKIANIVAVAQMKEPFDLEVLESKIENTELTPTKNWLKIRLKPKNNYVAFYASGKFLVTGMKTFEDVDDVVNEVMRKLHMHNIKAELAEIKVSNIVLSDEIELKNSLDDIINSLNSSNFSYEPEQFPGLFYKDSDGISYTLFASGKIVITGVKDLESAKNNLKIFKELIRGIN